MSKAKVAGYVRISSNLQEKGLSLELQEAKLQAYCELYDLNLVEVIVDKAVSAKTLDREGLSRVRGMITRKEISGVVVVKLDRLTRHVGNLSVLVEEFVKAKANLMSVSEQIDTRSAAGRAMLSMIGLMAQWERETIAERTKDSAQYRRSMGLRAGFTNRGFKVADDGVNVIEDPKEQAAIAEAKRLRATGLSLRKVSAQLHASGFSTRKGRPYGASSVMVMCS
ncbi:MAG: recombinase family protein [Deltaproteobacteria bacterium]|nr:recombinase family protein [Deltaproteobacteria bacterium]